MSTTTQPTIEKLNCHMCGRMWLLRADSLTTVTENGFRYCYFCSSDNLESGKVVDMYPEIDYNNKHLYVKRLLPKDIHICCCEENNINDHCSDENGLEQDFWVFVYDYGHKLCDSCFQTLEDKRPAYVSCGCAQLNSPSDCPDQDMPGE
jgi:hypothetical protein